ncbi:MAG: hypothetical protein GY765_39300, partial [bacterium]|nr:hypothetical protein [bacterium]
GELPGTDHRGHYLNAVFKVHRYALDYQGIKDKNTVPGKAIELPISQKGKTGLDGKSDVMRRTSNSRKRNKKYDKLRSLGYIN